MHILIFCHYGMNRSRYLVEYLVEQGYEDVQFAGIKDPDHEKIQKVIDKAEIIIMVSKDVARRLHEQYQIGNARMIELDAEDRPEVRIPGYPKLSGDEWMEFQRGYVYPALKEQLSRYLPF